MQCPRPLTRPWPLRRLLLCCADVAGSRRNAMQIARTWRQNDDRARARQKVWRLHICIMLVAVLQSSHIRAALMRASHRTTSQTANCSVASGGVNWIGDSRATVCKNFEQSKRQFAACSIDCSSANVVSNRRASRRRAVWIGRVTTPRRRGRRNASVIDCRSRDRRRWFYDVMQCRHVIGWRRSWSPIRVANGVSVNLIYLPLLLLRPRKDCGVL